jgi:hypothetical protein
MHLALKAQLLKEVLHTLPKGFGVAFQAKIGRQRYRIGKPTEVRGET